MAQEIEFQPRDVVALAHLGDKGHDPLAHDREVPVQDADVALLESRPGPRHAAARRIGRLDAILGMVAAKLIEGQRFKTGHLRAGRNIEKLGPMIVIHPERNERLRLRGPARLDVDLKDIAAAHHVVAERIHLRSGKSLLPPPEMSVGGIDLALPKRHEGQPGLEQLNVRRRGFLDRIHQHLGPERFALAVIRGDAVGQVGGVVAVKDPERSLLTFRRSVGKSAPAQTEQGRPGGGLDKLSAIHKRGVAGGGFMPSGPRMDFNPGDDRKVWF